MESYEDLRLNPKDKIGKIGFFSKLFKKDSKITEKNLDFLEEIEDTKSPIKDDDFLENENLENVLEDFTTQDHQKSENLISIEAQEKEEILENILDEDANISFRFVMICLCVMFLVFLLFLPKIYIRNNIYYASRNIIQLQAQLDSLNEENKFIKKQLENIKFKNLTQELDF